MSRIGRLPVTLEKGVKAQIAGDLLKVEGPKGKLELKVPPGFVLKMSDSQIEVKRPGDTQQERSLHGLVRKLVANMAEGVGKGFTRVLEINGVGYRAEVRGGNIHLTLGYSHPIVYQLPPGVTAKVDRQVMITLESADRQLIGTVAAQVRELRPPEPYKGKGIKYATEKIRRKAGKAAAGAAAG
jgi:large subunit ribosomal protein L6